MNVYNNLGRPAEIFFRHKRREVSDHVLASSHRETVQAREQILVDPDFEKSTEITQPLDDYLAEFLANQL